MRLGGDVVSATLRRDPYQPENPLFGTSERSWLATLELLRQVEQRKRPQSVVLVVGQQPMELPRYEEVADRVRGLVVAGHDVWVYLDGAPDDGAFLVAAAASRASC